ncbi:D-ribose pyranase [Peribacillus sp. B-H-3]|jgi:D-ribose pyranase|uniref:D-ribose pyranase n=1 Tax=Peribacillus sp. B-H-3 TaxID=3400420 RepID=UPI003B0154D1
MKRHGMLNSHISKVLSDLGHTDTIVIADAGLPIPEGVLRIDLALVPGTPSFIETVKAVSDDMVIEKITLAQEIAEGNPDTLEFIKNSFGDIEMEQVSHEEFKQKTKQAKAVIRTGEMTPYANCILHSGVFF